MVHFKLLLKVDIDRLVCLGVNRPQAERGEAPQPEGLSTTTSITTSIRISDPNASSNASCRRGASITTASLRHTTSITMHSKLRLLCIVILVVCRRLAVVILGLVGSTLLCHRHAYNYY